MRKPNLLNLRHLLSVSEVVFPWLVSSFSGYFAVMIGFPWMLINPCDQLFVPASLSPVRIFWVFLASVSEIDYISLDQPTSTVLTFVSGKGKVVQPMLIHKGKRVQENRVRKAQVMYGWLQQTTDMLPRLNSVNTDSGLHIT